MTIGMIPMLNAFEVRSLNPMSRKLVPSHRGRVVMYKQLRHGHLMQIWLERCFARQKFYVHFGFFQLGKRLNGQNKIQIISLTLVNEIW